MSHKISKIFIMASFILAVSICQADSVSLGKGENLQNVLSAHVDKRVTVRTTSGAELTGKVMAVTDSATHIAELSGREFFDAVINNQNIEAVIIRTRTQ